MKLPDDRRIWSPDETCHPFYIDNAVNNVNILIARLRTPPDSLNIITSISCGTNIGVATKNDARIVIIRGFHPPGSGELVNAIPIKLSGGLIVDEIRDPGEPVPNVPREAGFYVAPFPEGMRACRIVLIEGDYSIVARGSGAFPVYFSASGYSFSLIRKNGS